MLPTLPLAVALVPSYEDDAAATIDVTFWVLLPLAILFAGFGIYARRNWARERRRSRELSVEEQRYRTLFENARDVLFTLSADLHIDSINAAIQRLTGRPRESFLGQPFPELCVDDREREHLVEHLRNVAEHGAPGTTQFRIAASDGERVLELCSHVVLSNGDTTRIQGMARDVTMRLQLERGRLQSEQLDAVGRFSGGLAYDFNNVLTIIRGHTEQLRELSTTLLDEANDEMAEGLDAILAETRRAELLTLQLAGHSRRATGESSLLDLHEIVTATVGSLTHLLPEDIESELDLRANAAHVFADRGVIEQILLNLLLNARDAMPDGGKILISTDRRTVQTGETVDGLGVPPGSWVSLTVADSGVGMDEATRGRVFEPFFSTKDAKYGTGLGLAVVQCALTRMGGYVAVKSEPENGARFTIWLPWSDLLPGQTPEQQHATPTPTGTTAADTRTS